MIAYTHRLGISRPSQVRPNGSSWPMFIHSASFAPGIVEPRNTSRIAVRNACSSVPGLGRPSIPKTPPMITSSVIACIRGASAIVRPTDQRPISRSAASAIIRS